MGQNDILNSMHLMKMQMDMNASLIAGKNPKGGPLNVDLSEVGKKLGGKLGKPSEKGKAAKRGDKSGKAGKANKKKHPDGKNHQGLTGVDTQDADGGGMSSAADQQGEAGAGSSAAGGRSAGSGAGVIRGLSGAGSGFGQSMGRQSGLRRNGQYTDLQGTALYPAQMTLRQAVVWSEVLGEPVSKRRRRQRMTGQPLHTHQ